MNLLSEVPRKLPLGGLMAEHPLYLFDFIHLDPTREGLDPAGQVA
jgi:hypothetical protein